MIKGDKGGKNKKKYKFYTLYCTCTVFIYSKIYFVDTAHIQNIVNFFFITKL